MRKFLLILLLLSLFLTIAGSVQAYVTIVKDYPELPACKDNKECRPGEKGFGLPEFVKYIFIFSLGAVGIIGMLALILAAFDYVMSAGNPQKAAEGKDRIVAALLGLLLLLASWVLLNLVNPDLLKLGLDVKPLKTVPLPSGENGGNGGGEKIRRCLVMGVPMCGGKNWHGPCMATKEECVAYCAEKKEELSGRAETCVNYKTEAKCRKEYEGCQK